MCLGLALDCLYQRGEGGSVQRGSVRLGHQQSLGLDPRREPAEIKVGQGALHLLPPDRVLLGRVLPQVIVNFFQRVGLSARGQVGGSVRIDRTANYVGDLRAEGRRGQGQVSSDGGQPGQVNLRPPGQVLQAAAAVGYDSPVDVGFGVGDSISEQAGEVGGIGRVRQPLPRAHTAKVIYCIRWRLAVPCGTRSATLP